MAQNEQHANGLVRPGRNARRIGSLYYAAEVLASTLVCIAVISTFVLRYVGVDGSSMRPTLEGGQRLVSTAVLLQPRRGDIVVLSPANRHNKPLIKRVIAVAGDEIDISNGRVLINGAAIDEPYLGEGVMTYPASRLQNGPEYPVLVPENHVFVMGDNRGDSSDSRSSMVGFVRADDILGKAAFRTWPFFATKPFQFMYRIY